VPALLGLWLESTGVGWGGSRALDPCATDAATGASGNRASSCGTASDFHVEFRVAAMVRSPVLQDQFAVFVELPMTGRACADRIRQ
jgi:hypothetical protein